MRRIGLLFASAIAAACSSGGGNSVPPETGLVVSDVGGPDAAGGAGQVPFRVYVTGVVVSGGTLDVVDHTRGTDSGSHDVTSKTWVQFTVAGDVGDEVTLTSTSPAGTPTSVDYVIPPPTILEIHAAGGTAPVVHAGQDAEVRGFGFSIVSSSDAVTFDGASVPLVTGSNGTPHPGLLLFSVPAAAAPGSHVVVITVAGAYASAPFPVDLP